MSYKIAVASSDGINVNQSFGAADVFRIYEVTDDRECHLLEFRKWNDTNADSLPGVDCKPGIKSNACDSDTANGLSHGTGNGCGSGNGGCGGFNQTIPKLELIADCRSILCSKIGFQVRRQMEKKAIIAFDIEYPIEEALKKIAMYFTKVDKHQSLKGIARRQKQD